MECGINSKRTLKIQTLHSFIDPHGDDGEDEKK